MVFLHQFTHRWLSGAGNLHLLSDSRSGQADPGELEGEAAATGPRWRRSNDGLDSLILSNGWNS